MYTREKEIRKLTSIQLYELAQILDLNDSWKKLMRIIPKNAFSDSPEDIKIYKYNLDHERLIENASKIQHRMAAEILFEEWGTSGRTRPTLGVLLELLARAELFRAADLVAIKYLNEPPPDRPTQGPAAKIDISIPFDSEFLEELEDMLENGDCPGTETLNDNAFRSRLADNNIDYYEKYTPNDKRLSILPQIDKPSLSTVDKNISDLMKFSSTSPTTLQDVIPVLSELHQSSSAPLDSNNSSTLMADQQSSDSMNLPILSALAHHSSISNHTSRAKRLSTPPQINEIDKPSPSTFENNSETQTPFQHSDIMTFESTNVTAPHDLIPILSELDQTNPDEQPPSSMDLPILSALNTQSSVEDIIPNLSTLNVHADSANNSNSKPLNNLSPSRQSLSSASTISSSSDEVDDDISAPNLSILDQRSSNNDSSLTNVTATSEDNSFDISLNEGSTSFDNIPCLSALK